jgi:hypothetical protein
VKPYCETCHARLVQTSVAYLCCPNGHGGLVPIDMVTDWFERPKDFHKAVKKLSARKRSEATYADRVEQAARLYRESCERLEEKQ